MRIGITCYPTFGGSGVVASELGRELAKHHEVHFISYSLPFRLDEKVHFHRVDMLKYPLFKFPPYTLALTSKMAEVCVKEKLELLHVHYAIPHSTSAYLAKKLTNRVKIVTTLHGTDVQLVGLDPSYKSITKFSMEKSDGLTSVSNYLKRLTIKEFGIKSHIEVIHNFIDPLKFKRRFVERKEKVIVHVSNFRRIKRIPDIIHAFKLITKRIECRLTMVGDGPEKSKVKRLAKELGLKDMIKFTGNLKDVSRVLSSSSLFLLPSEMESFGLAALEAMSCEVPIVATKTGGLPEVITKECGFLVKIGDIEEIAEKCLMILENEDFQKKMGKAGRNRVLRYFTPEKIVPKYERYYERVLKG